MREDRVAVLDSGAAADLERFRQLGNHNLPSRAKGSRRISTCPACAPLKFGDGRLREVLCAADITLGVAGPSGRLTAFVLEADSPAVLRKGALGALGGQLDFACDALPHRNQGAEIPLKVNRLGHPVLPVVAFGCGPRRVGGGPKLAASYFEWAFAG